MGLHNVYRIYFKRICNVGHNSFDVFVNNISLNLRTQNINTPIKNYFFNLSLNLNLKYYFVLRKGLKYLPAKMLSFPVIHSSLTVHTITPTTFLGTIAGDVFAKNRKPKNSALGFV